MVVQQMEESAEKYEAQAKEAEKQLTTAREGAMKSIREQARADVLAGQEAAKSGGEQTSFSRESAENLVREYDAWDKKDSERSFVVGSTSDVLQSVGLPLKPIIWSAKKILKIQNDHPAMTDDIIKQVPNAIASPVIVMQSRTVPDRVTMFGNLYDADGVPVLVVLNPNPVINGSYDVYAISVSSAYGKDRNTQGFIDRSNVLYVDKNRADQWSEASRLQLPLTSNPIGSANSIAQKGDTVNDSVSIDCFFIFIYYEGAFFQPVSV